MGAILRQRRCNGPGYLIRVGAPKLIAPGSAKLIAAAMLAGVAPFTPLSFSMRLREVVFFFLGIERSLL
jgi:hypothetical protein